MKRLKFDVMQFNKVELKILILILILKQRFVHVDSVFFIICFFIYFLFLNISVPLFFKAVYFFLRGNGLCGSGIG